MFSARSVRSRGWVLIVIGAALAIFMGVVIFNQAINVYHSGEPGARVRFTGGTGMLWLMFGAMGLVFSLGIACIANGIWQVLYGKRNSNMASILLGMFALLAVIAGLVILLSPAQEEQPERRTVQPPKLTTSSPR
jgi:hypothetical protein